MSSKDAQHFAADEIAIPKENYDTRRLVLLNGLPALAIAYDNTKVSPRPVRWNMP